MGMSAAFVLSALVQFLLGLVVAWLLGPAEFGAYALAVAAGILLQTLCFEWLRLAATRFFHAGAAGLRRRLILAFLASVALALLVAALAWPLLPGGRPALAALGVGLALGAGFLDLVAAMLRARFREGDYASVLLVRNALGITLVPLAAGLGGTAEAAASALFASLLVASVAAWHLEAARIQPGEVAEPAPPLPSLFTMAGYSGPIVVTNLLYLALFFGLRSWAALTGGLALAGQVSLALDFVLKLFTTFGSALDLWLFQRAVQAARENGPEAGQAQLGRNQEMVLSLLLAMALGLLLVIDALEVLLVRPDFRGPFGHAVMLLTPGIFLYALIQYAVHPYAQLAARTRTLPVTAMAVVVLAAMGGGVLALWPARMGGAGIAGIGLVLAASMAVGLLFLAARSPGYQAPSPRFLGKLTVAILTMVLPVALVRQWDSGLLAALGAIGFGAAGFGLAAWLVDLAGVRQIRLPRRGVS
ncbi:MAG: hypothetical protein O9342_13465 [Beijerinckiaceae bacterium]|nr:hypothetical protein [Beijerinckiaceae bacterium]